MKGFIPLPFLHQDREPDPAKFIGLAILTAALFLVLLSFILKAGEVM